MEHEIVLPFSVAGEVWKEGGNSGVQVNREIHAWLRESNLRWSRAFKSHTKFGFPHSVIFYFSDKSHAALFKLTWGGR